MSHLEISICIVTRSRPGPLARCLRDLLAQEDAPRWELLVAADGDTAVERTIQGVGIEATVMHTVGLTLGENRNLLIDKANGNLLVFLDDDVRLPVSFLAGCAALTNDNPGIDVFGGPNLTPVDAGRFTQVQGRLLATPWLTGPMSRRYRPATRARSTGGIGLTLCNLGVRAEAAPRFPSGQHGGEENAMLADLRRQGRRMLLHPDMTVAHERRSTVAGFAVQIHKYGYGRGEVMARRSSALGVVTTCAVAGWITRRWRSGLMWGVAVPVATAAVAGLRASPDGSHRVSDITQAMVIPHAYGVGVLRGLMSSAFARMSRSPGSRWGRRPRVQVERIPRSPG